MRYRHPALTPHQPQAHRAEACEESRPLTPAACHLPGYIVLPEASRQTSLPPSRRSGAQPAARLLRAAALTEPAAPTRVPTTRLPPSLPHLRLGVALHVHPPAVRLIALALADAAAARVPGCPQHGGAQLSLQRGLHAAGRAPRGAEPAPRS